MAGTGLVFSKRRMIERLNNEGKGAEITPEIIAVMDALDGTEAIANCWDRVIKDEPVYYAYFRGDIPAMYKGKGEGGRDVEGEYVNENDCVPLSVWESEQGLTPIVPLVPMPGSERLAELKDDNG